MRLPRGRYASVLAGGARDPFAFAALVMGAITLQPRAMRSQARSPHLRRDLPRRIGVHLRIRRCGHSDLRISHSFHGPSLVLLSMWHACMHSASAALVLRSPTLRAPRVRAPPTFAPRQSCSTLPAPTARRCPALRASTRGCACRHHRRQSLARAVCCGDHHRRSASVGYPNRHWCCTLGWTHARTQRCMSCRVVIRPP
jgi:hypothetical protein